MHNFFLNATKEKVSYFENIFDDLIMSERVISVDCPLAGESFEAMAQKLGEIIDKYDNVDSNFNIIMYCDVTENPLYQTVSLDKTDYRDRRVFVCQEVYRELVALLFYEKIYLPLKESGRMPNNVMLCVDEEDIEADSLVKVSLHEYLLPMIGARPQTEIEALWDEKKNSGLPAQECAKEFESELMALNSDELIRGVRSCVRPFIRQFCLELASGTDPERAWKQFVKDVETRYESITKSITVVELKNNQAALKNNRKMKAERDLKLNSLLNRSFSEGSSYRSAQAYLDGIDLQSVIEFLDKKQKQIEAELTGIPTNVNSFVKLKLAPVLDAFANRRFAMDISGHPAYKLLAKNAEETDQEERQNINDGKAISNALRKQIIVDDTIKTEPLVSNYEYFDSSGLEAFDEEIEVEDYENGAIRLRGHHLSYLRNLKMHLTDILSHYAGRSEQYVQELLPKRKLRSPGTIRRGSDNTVLATYADPLSRVIENRKIEILKEQGDNAYETSLKRYLEFCAEEKVTLSDLKEESDWFINRMNEITESLKSIKKVGIGTTVGATVLFAPLVVMGGSVIFSNPLSVVVALASMLLPGALVAAALKPLKRKQLNKRKDVIDKYIERSEKALESNKEAVDQYEDLLSFYIPSVRFSYDYKQDVEFYRECCASAEAKLNHHKAKMRERLETIGNIMEDLEVRPDPAVIAGSGAPEYRLPFCVGDKNRAFYSILMES